MKTTWANVPVISTIMGVRMRKDLWAWNSIDNAFLELTVQKSAYNTVHTHRPQTDPRILGAANSSPLKFFAVFSATLGLLISNFPHFIAKCSCKCYQVQRFMSYPVDKVLTMLKTILPSLPRTVKLRLEINAKASDAATRTQTQQTGDMERCVLVCRSVEVSTGCRCLQGAPKLGYQFSATNA